jgi:hypothetical protein
MAFCGSGIWKNFPIPACGVNGAEKHFAKDKALTRVDLQILKNGGLLLHD